VRKVLEMADCADCAAISSVIRASRMLAWGNATDHPHADDEERTGARAGARPHAAHAPPSDEGKDESGEGGGNGECAVVLQCFGTACRSALPC
jgi:hypothetical protein